jgi:nucleoside-diphosphate-sugar epimerase
MTAALIGHTGFVGGNLARQHRFDACFNSRNFRAMAGRRFDLLACAGLSAAKWLANREPEADRERIAALCDVLATVEAKRVILISTIDVYPSPDGVDESTTVDADAGRPYGRHRLQFERFIAGRFREVLVARLPGLFGTGIKKNVLFDLLHDNGLEAINPASRFQWYDLAHLWRDLTRCLALDLRLVNLVNEPIATADILARFFPRAQVGSAAPAVAYDVRSLEAAALGGAGGYLQDRAAVLAEIGRFVAAATRRGAA